jgi:hypothetical protein
MAYRVIVLALAIIELVGCAECVTEGCDALRDRAPGHHSGIGGVVASQSDVVANGCQECGFAHASIEVFQLQGTLASADVASAAMNATSPLATIAADERYHLNLDPGAYLVCVTLRCIGVTVVADTVTTINIKLRYGPTSFFVIDSASNRFTEQFGLEHSAEDG